MNSYISAHSLIDHENVDYLVVDDVPYDKFLCFKAIVGCQQEFIITDKYMKKYSIKNWAKPCIILVNEDMFYPRRMERDMLNWFETNCQTITLNKPLY